MTAFEHRADKVSPRLAIVYYEKLMRRTPRWRSLFVTTLSWLASYPTVCAAARRKLSWLLKQHGAQGKMKPRAA